VLTAENGGTDDSIRYVLGDKSTFREDFFPQLAIVRIQIPDLHKMLGSSPAVGDSKDPNLHEMMGSFIIVSISVADPDL
jgi:hypothetical protein